MNHLKKIINLYNTYKNRLSKLSIIIICLILYFALYGLYSVIKSNLKTSTESADSRYEDCNVAPIQIHGELLTYIPTDAEGQILEGYEDTTASEDVMYLVGEAEYTDDIKGILIEVDSFGGSPAAAEEIATALKASQKPVVAYIREAGLSAAYFAITPADKIFALKSSDVGSIGTTQSYVDNVSKNQSEGYSFVQLSVGKFKDAGNPDKPLTQEEKNLFMRDLHILQENFIQTVSENRTIAMEKVRAIADGSSVLGEQAKELRLIDEIGDYSDALIYLEGEMGEEVRVCW